MKAGTLDNLMITMGMHAGYLLDKGVIEIPEGLEGEDVLADFIVEAVDIYCKTNDFGEEGIPFCLYCDKVLELRFNKSKQSTSYQTISIDQYSVVATPRRECPVDLESEDWFTVFIGTRGECIDKVRSLLMDHTDWMFQIRDIRK